MNPFRILLHYRSHKRTAFFIAVYFFFVSFLPFSHCHAIEENHHGTISSEKGHDHQHDNSNHTHADFHNHDDSCCETSQESPDHHHFISEFFHYSSERKRFLSAFFKTVSLNSPSLADQPVRKLIASSEIFRDYQVFNWFSAHCYKLVSGISPP